MTGVLLHLSRDGGGGYFGRVTTVGSRRSSPTLFVCVCNQSAQKEPAKASLRRNGRPKGCFWRVRFFSARLRLALKTPERS